MQADAKGPKKMAEINPRIADDVALVKRRILSLMYPFAK